LVYDNNNNNNNNNKKLSDNKSWYVTQFITNEPGQRMKYIYSIIFILYTTTNCLVFLDALKVGHQVEVNYTDFSKTVYTIVFRL